MNVKTVPIGELKPYAKNARTHSKDQINQIAESIKKFGFNNPILVDSKMTVIAGHGRLEAAKKLELKEVPIINLVHMSDAEKKAYIIADNKIAQNAEWNDNILQQELMALKEAGEDLSITGFNKKELDKILDDFKTEYDNDGNDGDGDGSPEFIIVVTCTDENHQQEIYEEFQERKLDCRIMT